MTTDEFIEKAKSIHGDRYDYSNTEYVSKRTKIRVICPIHGEFVQLPSNHLHGQGCPVCGKERASSARKNGYGEFMEKVRGIHGDRYIFPNIGNEYENRNSIVTVKCTECGNTFSVRASYMLSGKYPCKCERDNARCISYEALGKHECGYEIVEFEGKRHISTDKVECICPRHGKFTARITEIINEKVSCPKCGQSKGGMKRLRNGNDVISEISSRYPTVKCVNTDEYVNMSVPLTFRCLKCGNTFSRKPNTFLSSVKLYDACPYCSKRKVSLIHTKTTEEFIADVDRIYGKGRYEVIGEYVSSDSKVEIRCTECGRTFTKEANSFLQGNGCPYHNCNSSGKEKELYEFVRNICADAVSNDRTILNGMELDVYVPSRGIAFEFDGIFWHNEENKPNDYHIRKTEMCKEKNIRLIHVFEDEWNEKREIWESMIRHIFKMTERRIYARKCKVRIADDNEANDFLRCNHIQGWCPSSIKLGLYYGDELVSLMTFGKSRHFIGNGKTEYELLRFCNRCNTSVIGGASKLFGHFIRNYSPRNIVSYADRRWSVGKLYDALGFTLMHCSRPNYFYVIDNRRRNRFNFRKKILTEKYGCPMDMSEREFCKMKKWYRIYDCGTMVYMWNAD